MSRIYYKRIGKSETFEMPPNLCRYIKTTPAGKWQWLAENLCMRPLNDPSMFPAAVPWCELVGLDYEASDAADFQLGL